MKRLFKQYKAEFGMAQFLIALLALVVWVAVEPISGLAMAAVVAVKSTAITNADAVPSVINKAHLQGARIRRLCAGVCAVGNGDSINSTYRFGRIKSSDVVTQVIIDAAGGGTVGAGDIGLYDKNGGAVVDADFFASAQALNAALRAVDITRESGVITVANMEKRVWELLGLTADPHKEYDVTMTLTAATDAAQSVHLQVNGVGGN